MSFSRKTCELSLIIPTYNEADNIPELIERVERSLKGRNFEIIVIDDNSEDGTADIAEKLGAKYGNVKVLRRNGRLGLGSAVVDGIRMSSGDLLAVMDADLQHPPELLPKMVKAAEKGFDVVIASRYVDSGGVKGWSYLRRVISTGAILLAHILLPKVRTVKDPVSGFFLIRSSVVDGVPLNHSGYKILPEILVKGRYSRVAEVPYILMPRRRGESKLNSREIISYALLLLKLRARR
jgi:dolichol-phosphate mannosyltransferase